MCPPRTHLAELQYHVRALSVVEVAVHGQHMGVA
jgi:hypothetical protein